MAEGKEVLTTALGTAPGTSWQHRHWGVGVEPTGQNDFFKTPRILGSDGVWRWSLLGQKQRQREQLESITEGRVIPFQLLLSIDILLVLLLLSLFLLTALRLCTSDVIFFSIFTFFFLFLLFLFTAVLILVSLLRQKAAVDIILAKKVFSFLWIQAWGTVLRKSYWFPAAFISSAVIRQPEMKKRKQRSLKQLRNITIKPVTRNQLILQRDPVLRILLEKALSAESHQDIKLTHLSPSRFSKNSDVSHRRRKHHKHSCSHFLQLWKRAGHKHVWHNTHWCPVLTCEIQSRIMRL